MRLSLYQSMKQLQYHARPSPPSPTLYRFVAERKFREIPSHVRQFPQDCIWIDRYGTTALHLLCQIIVQRLEGHTPASATRSTRRRNLHQEMKNNISNNDNYTAKDVITTRNEESIEVLLTNAFDTILKYCPSELIGQPNVGSWTPMHLLCQGSNISIWEELVLKLIHTYPQAVSIRLQNAAMNKTPFHIVCEKNGPYNILYAMLQVDPSLATQPQHISTTTTTSSFRPCSNYDFCSSPANEDPLKILWDAYTKTKAARRSYLHYINSNEDSNYNRSCHDNEETETIYDSIHRKMELILRAAYCGNIQGCHTNNNNGNGKTICKNQSTETEIDVSKPSTSITKTQQQESLMLLSSSSSELSSFQLLLSAICSIRCPFGYISKILSMYSSTIKAKYHTIQQITETATDGENDYNSFSNNTKDITECIFIRDEHGMLPLHYVAKNATLNSQNYTEFLIESIIEIDPLSASQSFPMYYYDHHSTYLNQKTMNHTPFPHRVSSATTAAVRTTTVVHDQTNSSQNNNSNEQQQNEQPQVEQMEALQLPLLPLHVLLTDHAMTWDKGGICKIVYAYSDALHMIDPRNGLFPFMASAIHATKSRGHLTTTYQLLLAAPDAVTCS